MSDFIPINDLDRATMKLQKSRAALPEFMRCLGAGELWFFVPWHPEVEDAEMEIKNGMELPFSQIEDEKGPVVPLFSSFERAREAMKKFRLPARTYSTGALEAKVVLQILGAANLRAVVNKGCKTGEVTVGAELMRDVADGSAFATEERHAARSMKMQILDPADYPTGLIQPLFDFMRQHRSFRAAWVFGRQPTEPEPEGGRGYKLIFLMDPHDAGLMHDLNLVAQAAKGKGNELDLGLAPENDAAYVQQLFREARAFYVAADYELPPGAKV